MISDAEASYKVNAARNVRGWLLALCVSLGTASLVSAPFFVFGNALGHDFGFHVCSWLDVAEQWREGIICPRWAEWANNGFGEPRFIFYPPLSWLLGAALTFVVPLKALSGTFIVLTQTAGGLSLYALGRRVLPPRAALIASACYAANPYALLDIYLRSAFGEVVACASVPLVILATLELAGVSPSQRRSVARTVSFFAVAFATVWLSDVPVGIIMSYSVAFVISWTAFQEKTSKPLSRGAAGLTLGFGLTGFYLLPAAYERRWVHVARLLPKGLLPMENFLFSKLSTDTNPKEIPFDWIASSVAVLLIFIIIILFIYVVYQRRSAKLYEKTIWPVLLLLSGAATFLMIRPSAIFWKYLPELLFVQFPWRWMSILAVVYALLMGAVAHRGAIAVWLILVLGITGTTATFAVQTGRSQKRWGGNDVPSVLKSITSDQGFAGTGEYQPFVSSLYPALTLPQELQAKFMAAYYGIVLPKVQIVPSSESSGSIPRAKVRIEKWTAEERNAQVTSTLPLLVAFRLLNYPAWRLEVNGKTTPPQGVALGEFNIMVVQVAAGKSEIRVRFVRTPDRFFGNALSAASILAIVIASFWKKAPAVTVIEKEATAKVAPLST